MPLHLPNANSYSRNLSVVIFSLGFGALLELFQPNVIGSD